jgi:hypothetical protein
MTTASYYVISHYPSRFKSEHVNIGIVVFIGGEDVRIHFIDDLKKVKVIDPNAKVETIRSWENTLPALLLDMPIDRRVPFLQNFGSWAIPEMPGTFVFENSKDYLARVATLMDHLAVARPRHKPSREHISRLHLDVKDQFQIHGWLGKDIKNHEIVTRYELREEVNAEFALRNGKLHVIETLDLRTSNLSEKRKEARSKALVLDVAKRIDASAQTYTIIAGLSQHDTQGTRDLMNDYSDRVVHWEDTSDIEDFYITMSKAVGKPMINLQ